MVDDTVSWEKHAPISCSTVYGSEQLLIELLPKSADDTFFCELLQVLKQVNAKVADVRDVWMNDEVWLSFNSDVGPFLVTKDIWDLVFIMAPENEAAIPKIAEALRANAQFQSEVVDFDEYR
jgi:hypothetical protein